MLNKFLITLLLMLCVNGRSNASEIALIIDDMGNNYHDYAAFELPVEVAFSVLPLTGLSEYVSQRAASEKREVMLHIPMESLAGKELGPGGLTSDMQEAAILETLQQALNSVPHAIGVNNHMGSKLTQLSLPMSVTMEFLVQHQLFFVDSRTTRYSKAERIARENGVLSTKRNVFLDHDPTPAKIHAQFQRLLRLSKKYGYAVGIGHPYPETVAYLKQALDELDNTDIRLVTISDIMRSQQFAKNDDSTLKKTLEPVTLE